MRNVYFWFARREKIGEKIKDGGRVRRGENLFIDVRKLGRTETRTLHVLSGREEYLVRFDSDVGTMVHIDHARRGDAGGIVRRRARSGGGDEKKPERVGV